MVSEAAAALRAPAWRPTTQVLVADDDAASRRYLGDTLVALGAEATVCSDGAQATQLASTCRFDLLLLDCRMPGAGALDVLAMLRGDASASSGDAVAVASTAESDAALAARLLAAGFQAILHKPCELAQLRDILLLAPGAVPPLDDAAAMRAAGSLATMQALRGLLRAELVSLRRDLATLSIQRGPFGERLHRLRSSCGFCGAPALAAAVTSLQHRLRSSAGIRPSTLLAFDVAIGATLEALEGDGAAR